MNDSALARRTLLKSGMLFGAAGALAPAGQEWLAAAEPSAGAPGAPANAVIAAAKPGAAGGASCPLQFRGIWDNLNHPYWFAQHNNPGASQAFWDKAAWEAKLTQYAQAGYNAIYYWTEPWLVHQWQTFLIPHKGFPEARDLPPDKQEAVIKQAHWIFGKVKELGMRNYISNMCIVTTPAFARAHGLDKDMPLSDKVDWRHNYQQGIYDKMIHWGVRNDLTRDFTVAAIAELFQTYPELDGMVGCMGEALPGNRSSWFKEAIVPGLRRSGRKPVFIMFNWMLPLEEFVKNIAPAYENLWISVEHNGELISDTKPYPIALRWPEQSGLPTILTYVPHNFGSLPWNSPKFACEMVRQTRKVDHCLGFFNSVPGSPTSPSWELAALAWGYYGRHDEPYSDAPWVKILQERFGDRAAAQRLLNAFNASGYITPMVNQIAWCPQDGRCAQQLILKYWFWTGEEPRYSHYVSPPMGDILLPLRFYAETVVKFGPLFRDNDGTNIHAPGSGGRQELIWGHIDYMTTPEAHMRQVRRLGEEALREAEEGLKTVKKNRDQAELIRNQMKAYKLLTDYYERKVLAAISALIYGFGRQPEERTRAEKLADQTLELYKTAIQFIYETLDHKSGNMRGGWHDEIRDLPGLIELETKDRKQLATLFGWPQAPGTPQGGKEKTNLGTTLKGQ